MAYSLLTFDVGGEPTAGIAVGERVIDLAAATENPDYASVDRVLSDWPVAGQSIAALARKAAAGELGVQPVPLHSARLHAPFMPGAIFCAGANYIDHIEEMARALGHGDAKSAKEHGEDPWHFVKPPRNTVVGPGASIELPAYSTRIDYEIELVAVIGRQAKNVPVESALDHVAGYTIGNDLSVREVGRQKTPQGSPFHYDWISMKCFDGSGPLGPWIVPAEQIGDPQSLALRLWVNDEVRQDSNTSRMVFTVAEQIAWLSSRVTLYPGDAIFTGTPAGVGLPYGKFLRPGDTIRMWIEGIGEMSNRLI